MNRILLGFGLAVAALPRFAAAERPIVAFNQDCTEMQARFADGEVDREGIRRFFRRMSRGGLTHYLVNPNCHNTAYDSKVWDSVWHEDPRLRPTGHLRQFDRSRILHEKGIDWVGEIVALCREQGVSPWISMRMNDVHNIAENLQFAQSSYYLDHPEFSRACGKANEKGCNRGWDYGRPEVRARSLALAREMLGKWDADGFECDWMRYHRNVTDEAERDGSGRASLTAYMREMRKLADEIGAKRGRRILIGVRVATLPEAALGLGMDSFAWAKEGLVDWVVPCNAWLCDDFRLPFAEWKARLREANPAVRLLGGLDFGGIERERGVAPQAMTVPEFNAYMERMYAAGVTDFYAFNLFIRNNLCGDDDPIATAIERDGLRGLSERCLGETRAYPVTHHDAVPVDFDDDRRLPAFLKDGGAFEVDVARTGSPVAVGVLLGVQDEPEDLKALGASLSLNGVSPTGVVRTSLDVWMPWLRAQGKKRKTTHLYRFEFPLTAVKAGNNAIGLKPVPGSKSRLWSVELVLDGATPRTTFVPLPSRGGDRLEKGKR